MSDRVEATCDKESIVVYIPLDFLKKRLSAEWYEYKKNKSKIILDDDVFIRAITHELSSEGSDYMECVIGELLVILAEENLAGISDRPKRVPKPKPAGE